MKNSSNARNLQFVASVVIVFLAFSSIRFAPAAQAQATTDNGAAAAGCATWAATWLKGGNGATATTYVSVDTGSATNFTAFPDPTVITVSAGDKGSTSSTPPTLTSWSALGAVINTASSTYSDGDIGWFCANQAVAGTGLKGGPDGTEECVAAAQMAAKYGAYTALNTSIGGIEEKIRTQLLQKTFSSLENQFQKVVGDISLSKLFGTSTFGGDTSLGTLAKAVGSGNPTAIINALGVDNKFKDAVKTTTDEAMAEAKKQIQSLVGDLTKQAADILKVGVPTGILTNPVPVNDAGTQSQTKANGVTLQNILLEQRKQEITAKTRTQCRTIFTQTVQSIKSSLLYQFTNETVNWIQGGGIQISSDGKITINAPQYFEKPWKSLEQAGLGAVDRFLSNVAPQLCQPFRLSVTLQIPSTARQTNPYYQPTSCTLNRVVQNIQGFYNNFRQGSWLGYREILLPPNNYYGASALAQQQAAQIAAAATQQRQNEVNQSNGYKNKYQCTQWLKYQYAKDANGNVITNVTNCSFNPNNPKSLVWASSENACYENLGPVDADNDTGVPTDASTYIKDPAQANVVGDKVFPSKSDHSFFYTCLDSQIVQPSNVAAGLAQQSTQADINAIINAQDLTNIDTVIQNAIINKITKVGINGLKGVLGELPAWTNNLLK